ncbi:MAG: IS1634 family transposase [Candidatus Ratteibacteria bacterium]
MFIRVVKVKDKKKNIVREYLRIVENYRERKKQRQRVIGHLGRVDLIPKGKLTELAKKLSRFEGNNLYSENDLIANSSVILGPVVIIKKIWEEIKIGKIIDDICGDEVSERAFVLVSCRLLEGCSEHGLYYFLKEYYVCDSKGRRWEDEFDDNFHKRMVESNGRDRVKVKWAKLQKWYRALDKLIENKEKIEVSIYEQMKDLFSLEVDIIFYDITSIYFEGKGPDNLARFGYSRDGKKDNRQILLGVVMADGLPIAHHIFPGGSVDKTTLDFVIRDLRERFKIRDIIFVADKGINTQENIKRLEEIGYRYILGVSLSNCKEAREIIENTSQLKWRNYNDDTRYSLVDIKGERWILVDSQEKRKYEEKMRQVWIEKGAKELDRLKERVEKGRLRDEKKIAYYLGSISKKYHIKRYFSWEIKGGLKFWIDWDKIKEEARYEGRYLLRTNDKRLKAEEVIRQYKNLWEIESCFRDIKDVIKIRPVYHKTEKRTKAHIFIGVIGYLIEKLIQKKIKQAKIRITTKDALEFSKSVKVVEIEVGEKKIKLITQKIDSITREVFNLLGIRLPRVLR